MTNLDEFRSRTREIVMSFLQTAVILDDLAVMSPSGLEPSIESITQSITVPDYPVSPAIDNVGNESDLRGARLNADAVVAGFADIGSVCAVLSATPGEDYQRRAVKAAQRADIVILDWKIHDTFGEEALEVMRGILQDDRHSRRLRLIAIYTDEPKLEAIRQDIQDAVADFYMDDRLKVERFRVSKGPLHVIVLAKENTLKGMPSDYRNQEVSERLLADRLVDEFALMTGGLLRNVAIAGIASIRGNAHRILTKFEQSLDSAYLGHRLLLHHPPDAEDHLVEAIGSELISILEEDQSGACANTGAIKSWLELQEREGLNLNDPVCIREAHGHVDVWLDLLHRGFEAPDALEPIVISKKQLQKTSTEPFAAGANDARQSNRRFAALLSLKTRYPGNSPRLSIGTVLCTRECNESRYFLCLQPKCDSVRLCVPTGFPLIPLRRLNDVMVGSGARSLRLVVETARDHWEHFGIETKPSEMTVRFFKPGPNPPGIVVATNDEDGKFYFKDVRKNKYRWMAELKDEHALAVAGEVASALGRPGPNDTEWLRRASGNLS